MTTTAIRWGNGEKLGRFPVQVLRPLAEDSYVVRFEDGHEAAAFEYELVQELGVTWTTEREDGA